MALFLAMACREINNTNEKMMPVEADGGIGDGAPSLDSLLKAQKDSVNIQQKDSL
ncbi:hypothetical protein C8D94_104287 [Marinirhabdus gelatinilytica]|uniref:Uncharacterized protein n=2 Tax=Marinirhabdus gelatinilytica TaxID=1703343 RepID=A0A370Q975_9FLAO|nr:hypothetical protein C8D94_104287 [Marinirhabdus gelatinilytica]